MSEQIELRYAELRELVEGSRIVGGPVVVYGDVASIGGRFRERVERGAFELPPAGTHTLTRQHKRELLLARPELVESDAALELRAELPDGPAQDQALADIRSGLLRGISAELVVLRARFEAGVRVIERARYVRSSLVDNGAYPQSVVEQREALEAPPRGRRSRVWL